MATAFTRQLGAESGVQLNPLRDNSGIPAVGNSDQVFGIVMRSTRGRIDKPFKVNRGNVSALLGGGETIKANSLNEAYVHVVEALNKGAYECVVQRLAPSTAQIYTANLNIAGDGTHTWTASLVADAAAELTVKHYGCFNDGIKFSIHSDEKKVGGVLMDNDMVTLRVLDAGNVVIHEFTGSLLPSKLDDSGNSLFLPNVIAAYTDLLEVQVASGFTVIATNSLAYGYDSFGKSKWATSNLLNCFVEGGFAYTTADYMRCREALQYSPNDFAYIASGGTQSTALLAQLAQLAFDTNRQLKFDVPSNLSADDAITFVEQLNMGANPTAHLIHAFWSPFTCDDPTGINPKSYLGTSTLNIAYCCLRNAQVNGRGFAPKNYPVAGREYPVQRTRITQSVILKDQQLNALAKAKINPVVYETYSGGGRYVFRDSLTCALVDSSLKKLISVADMSSHIDEAVTRAGKDFLQLPMKVAQSRMNDYLEFLFSGAQSSGWLVPSSDPSMGGKAYKFSVVPDEVRPYDKLNVSYWLRYDGVARQIFVTQTLTR
jgi:hypothetical protein